jgi:hypothetical protein
MPALRPAVATLEGRSRAAVWRAIREDEGREAEALRAAQAAAQACTTLRRQDRVRAAVDRLQPLVSRLEAHLRAELHDAMRQGDNSRRLRVEREIDELFALANEAAQEAGR